MTEEIFRNDFLAIQPAPLSVKDTERCLFCGESLGTRQARMVTFLRTGVTLYFHWPECQRRWALAMLHGADQAMATRKSWIRWRQP